MPFEIVRNDITNMQVDAIVNTANPRPVIGSGTDAGINKKAGPRLLEERKKIGEMRRGMTAITPAFNLDAKYVIHAVGPVWEGGIKNEEEILKQCYRGALQLAKEHDCSSIAFPLLSTGNYGFPKPLALQIAINEFSDFLLKNDMQIYLAVFNKEAFDLSEKLFSSVLSYIDENYISDKTKEEYDNAPEFYFSRFEPRQPLAEECLKSCEVKDAMPISTGDLNLILNDLDEGFSETLLHLIDKTGKKDSEIYKKANIDRKLFSKIRNNMDYKPSKTTAIAFALALELDLEGTEDFIGRAGYALSHSSKFDVIIEYFILKKIYDIFQINEVLFALDQPLIGA